MKVGSVTHGGDRLLLGRDPSSLLPIAPRVLITTSTAACIVVMQSLVPGEFEAGCVFPGAFETESPASFSLSPGASFDSLRTVPRHVPAGPGNST